MTRRTKTRDISQFVVLACREVDKLFNDRLQLRFANDLDKLTQTITSKSTNSRNNGLRMIYHFTAWFLTSDILSSTKARTCFNTLFSVASSPKNEFGSVLISDIKSFNPMNLMGSQHGIDNTFVHVALVPKVLVGGLHLKGQCWLRSASITLQLTKYLFDEIIHEVCLRHDGRR